ncbi:MAG: ABC transporter permease [Methanomassiliicoccales archaeon]|jgi:tungstate transport system permease protein|nr:ABC transporter permease [Methanomassiliicoccales archaeon]
MADIISYDVLQVTFLSLYVSGSATILGSLIGIPLGALIGLKEFGGKGLLKTITYTMYGFPPVISGLFIYYLFSRGGPLGSFGILFTPTAMILAQTLLVVPLVTGVTISAVSEVDKSIKNTILSLGASNRQATLTIIREAWVGVVTAVMIGFGRAIAEVGAAYMVGGNIEGKTRVLTTAIMLETRMGHFEYAVGLGVVLLIVACGVFLFMRWIQEREML